MDPEGEAMAVFIVAFSTPGVTQPAASWEAPFAEEACKRAWAARPFGDAVDATAMGGGYAYRLKREGLDWKIVDSRATPGLG